MNEKNNATLYEAGKF